MAFSLASAIRPAGEGRFEIDVDPRWLQGPGAYGGLTAAWLLRAMATVVGAADRLPRELSGQFCARVKPGPGEIQARILRRGMNVSFTTAELLQRGRVAASASAVFSVARPQGLAFADLAPPAVPPASECPAWTLKGGLPAYTSQLDLRHAGGPAPLSGDGGEPACFWVRPKVAEPVDAYLATGLLDCIAPAYMTRKTERQAAGTVSWSVHFMADLPRPDADPEAFHLLRIHSPLAAAGYSSEEDELWTPAGVLVARARQLVAVI
jgi:acyl-CoA thioesterase